MRKSNTPRDRIALQQVLLDIHTNIINYITHVPLPLGLNDGDEANYKGEFSSKIKYGNIPESGIVWEDSFLQNSSTSRGFLQQNITWKNSRTPHETMHETMQECTDGM